MTEGPSKISGPIPPDPTLFPDYYRHPLSARGRLEGNSLKLDLLSGPLALDPTLCLTCYSACPANPARVPPNAKDILEKDQKGTRGVLLQLDGISFYRDLPPKLKECKDHEKENVRRMREIQKKCREKELAREHSQPKPVKALWKSQKYENVESRVKAKLQESSSPPRAESQKFLKAYSRCGSGIKPHRSLSPSPTQMRATAEAEAVQAQSCGTKMQKEGKSINFVSYNARNAKRVQLRRSHSLQSLAEVLEQKHREQEEYNAKQKGHVPRYLLERKDLWHRELEERQSSMPDPAMPPGHTIMPESERLETLSNLKQSQEQLLRDLLLLPVRTDTLSIQRRRAELERKLSHVEEALKIFSRTKVFVKLDS
uniref:Enkurin domain containing 1 n=1 Tax=Sphenodon punctatus TaxID=8508 RepID=A0A8D0G764_SPHPU